MLHSQTPFASFHRSSTFLSSSLLLTASSEKQGTFSSLQWNPYISPFWEQLWVQHAPEGPDNQSPSLKAFASPSGWFSQVPRQNTSSFLAPSLWGRWPWPRVLCQVGPRAEGNWNQWWPFLLPAPMATGSSGRFWCFFYHMALVRPKIGTWWVESCWSHSKNHILTRGNSSSSWKEGEISRHPVAWNGNSTISSISQEKVLHMGQGKYWYRGMNGLRAVLRRKTRGY